MTSENSMYSTWADRVSQLVLVALIGFAFTQLWNLQGAISATATKLAELTVYSSETLINTRLLIQQGSNVAQVTTEQLRALEARVSSIEHRGSQVAQTAQTMMESTEQRVRELENFVNAHGKFSQQDYQQMLMRLDKLERAIHKK